MVLTKHMSKTASLAQIIKSVVASMFGVQSEQNREFDFQQRSFLPYLIVAISFVAFFVLSLVGLVNLILS